MKKLIIPAAIAIFGCSSCATVLGGRVTEPQKTIPGPGEQQRPVRIGYLAADLLLCGPCVIVDFATGAIYKPAKNGQKR